MMITQQVYAQALDMAGELEQKQQALLLALCRSGVASLKASLKQGLEPEDCLADFVSAAALLALAALSDAGVEAEAEQFAVGDMSIRTKRNTAAANCLRNQAKVLMTPYVKEAFFFAGV